MEMLGRGANAADSRIIRHQRSIIRRHATEWRADPTYSIAFLLPEAYDAAGPAPHDRAELSQLFMFQAADSQSLLPPTQTLISVTQKHAAVHIGYS
jgi:hypothetical protein